MISLIHTMASTPNDELPLIRKLLFWLPCDVPLATDWMSQPKLAKWNMIVSRSGLTFPDSGIQLNRWDRQFRQSVLRCSLSWSNGGKGWTFCLFIGGVLNILRIIWLPTKKKDIKIHKKYYINLLILLNQAETLRYSTCILTPCELPADWSN